MSKTFPYERVPANTSGSAVVDDGSLTAAGVRAVAANAASRRYASNFLMVGAKRSANHHPLFVAGPQIGYYYPGLTLEMDLHGPGIDARGAAMPGGPGDILIGRGPDFAWSLTSAGSDTNDQYVETLCGGSDTKYLYKGKCRNMGFVQAGEIAGQGPSPTTRRSTGRSQGYATVGGQRVAISFKRSSHGRDILWQLMFARLSQGKVTGVELLLPRGRHLAVHVQRGLRGRQAHRRLLGGAPPDPRPARGSAPAHPRDGPVRVARVPARPVASPPGRPRLGRARQLEQQAGARLRLLGLRVGLRVRPPGRACCWPGWPSAGPTTWPR